MSLIRESIWAAAAAVTLAASRFAVTAILARRLSVTIFGQFAYGQWLVDLAFLICSLGMTGVAGRYLAEYRHDPRWLSAFVKRWRPFAIGLPAMAGVVAAVGATIAGLGLDRLACVALAAWTIASGFWAMQTAALIGLQRFDLICMANVAAAAVMVGGALVIVQDASGPGSVFWVMASSSGIAALVGSAQTVKLGHVPPSKIDLTLRRDIRRYAFNIWLTSLLWSLVWSRGEMPIVHAYLGNDGVARYGAVLTLFGGAIQGVMLLVSGVAPHLTRLWGTGSTDQAVLLARRVMDMQLIVCGLVGLVLICFGRELLFLAFGPFYRAESGVLAILSLGLPAMAASSQGHLLQIATNARFSRNSTFVGVALLFGLATWLVAIEGLPGAAMARAITMTLVAAAALFVVRARWGVHGWSSWNVASTSLCVGGSAVLVLAEASLSWAPRAAVAVSGVTLIVLSVRRPDGRMQAHEIVSRLAHLAFPRTGPRERKSGS